MAEITDIPAATPRETRSVRRLPQSNEVQTDDDAGHLNEVALPSDTRQQKRRTVNCQNFQDNGDLVRSTAE